MWTLEVGEDSDMSMPYLLDATKLMGGALISYSIDKIRINIRRECVAVLPDCKCGSKKGVRHVTLR